MVNIEVGNKIIVVDIQSTNTYRDRYNNQCSCDQCVNFRDRFYNAYEDVVDFLKSFGIDVNYPIEIVEYGFNEIKRKREYSAFYSVKGILPEEKLVHNIGDTEIIYRSHEVEDEGYSNTGMVVPYFIIEVANVYLSDVKFEFQEALKMGREIEFKYNGLCYFESRENDTDWYIYAVHTKEKQHFSSPEDLLDNATLEGIKIKELWNEIVIDFIL